ncbi:hypothetical protein PHYPSEUDO_011936 [Phytophthora pseudosyringae]|uniref:Uncharacterized protein n=1 Tax=Phytophthora pseudosyringae TaxID=221518 RepID=A0A8T1V8J5_9STRA|nr:hypothetical protein PHYPSEUDO_011936 [Phytophthora pseudosyringae]
MEIDSYDQTGDGQRACDRDTTAFDTLRYRERHHQQNQHLSPTQQRPDQWQVKQHDHVRHPVLGYKPVGAAAQFRLTLRAEEDDLLWQKEAEAGQPGFREKTQHLLILWRFVQCVSFNDLKFSADTVETHIYSHWLRTAAALRAPPTSCNAQLEGVVTSFLSNVFESGSARATHASASSFSGTEAHTVRDQTTIRTSVHLFLRAFSSRSVQHLFHEACQLGSGGANKEWLRKRFVSLALDLYDILDDTLRQTPGSLIDALNEAFRVFTAQTHESSIAFIGQRRQSNQQQQLGGSGALHSAWGHRWLLDPGSVQLVALDSGTKRDARYGASLAAIAQLVREFGCVDITVAQDESACMSLRTALSFDGVMAMAPMELVLDGQMRGFRVRPSGISSAVATAGGWSVGDYEALLSDDGHCLNVHFFAFVEENTTSIPSTFIRSGGREGLETKVRRVSLSLALDQEVGGSRSLHPSDRFVVVHGTVYGSTFSGADGDRGVRPKLSAVSSGDRSAAWRELKWTSLFEVQAGYVAL